MKRLAFVLAASFAALPLEAREPNPRALQKAIDAIVDRPSFASAFWGVEVRGLRSGKVLYARNAGKSLKPASTLKLVTTAAALDALGPDTRLRTTVETAGRLDGQGRVLGDVYLVGGGDPNLSGRFHEGRILAPFEELAEQLRSAGVRRIEGRIIGHEGLFPGERRGDDWAWGDLIWSYGAEVSALSFNDNCADLRAAPGEREGDPLVVDRDPLSRYYRVESTATTGTRGTAAALALKRDLGTNVIRISGTLPVGGEPWKASVALEDPARYAATVFAEVLESRGIRVMGEVATSVSALPEGRRVLASLDSAPVAELVKTVDKVSQNLHAEILLRLVGTRRRGQGTAEGGREAVEDFLRGLRVSSEYWALQDGSGLSRSDLVSPHEVVSLLVAMDRHPHAEAFRAALPVAGVDGTLRSRMKGSAAEGRVQAKTGTLRHVNALAGYVNTREGDRLAFYAVVNHHAAGGSEAVGAVDEIAAVLAGGPGGRR